MGGPISGGHMPYTAVIPPTLTCNPHGAPARSARCKNNPVCRAAILTASEIVRAPTLRLRAGLSGAFVVLWRSSFTRL